MIKIGNLREETLIYLQLIDFFRKKKAILSCRTVCINTQKNSKTEQQIKEFMRQVNRLLKVERFMTQLTQLKFSSALQELQKQYLFGPQLLVSHVSEMRKAVKELEKMDPGLKLNSLVSSQPPKKTASHMVCIFHFNEEASRNSAEKIEEYLRRFEGSSLGLQNQMRQISLQDTLQEVPLDLKIFTAIASQSAFFVKNASSIRIQMGKVLLRPVSIPASQKLIQLQELHIFQRFETKACPGQLIENLSMKNSWNKLKKLHREVAIFDRCALVQAALKANSKLSQLKVEGLSTAVKAQLKHNDSVYLFCKKMSRDEAVKILTEQLQTTEVCKEVMNPESDEELREILSGLKLADEADRPEEAEYMSASTVSDEQDEQ